MGIDISASKVVTLNDSHQKRLVTDPNRPIKVSDVDGLKVSGVYRRLMDKETRDANPLIFALKGTEGFRIDLIEVMKFRQSFYPIVNKLIVGKSADYVVPMPSSHNISWLLASRLSRKLGAELVDDFLVKSTFGSVLASFNKAAVKRRDLRKINAALHTMQQYPDTIMSLKHIDPSIRRYFSPVEYNASSRLHQLDGRVILVDDLLATGTTLVAARDIVNMKGGICEEAVCLLSGIHV